LRVSEAPSAGRAPAKAVPQPTPETAEYWSAAARGELRLPYCSSCQQYVCYPRGACPTCWSTDLKWTTLSGRGRLYSYLISHLAAPGFDNDVPYAIAIVELDEGPKLMSSIVGVPQTPEALLLDMPVAVEFEPRGDQMLPVFRPTGDGS
jgi:uncharacterized OB-fold protein